MNRVTARNFCLGFFPPAGLSGESLRWYVCIDGPSLFMQSAVAGRGWTTVQPWEISGEFPLWASANEAAVSICVQSPVCP